MINAIERAAQVLDLLLEDDQLSFTEICEKLQLSKSSAHVMLQSLTELDLLRIDKQTERYMLGLRLLTYGEKAQSQLNLRKIAIPILTELSAVSEETAFLAILASNKQIIVESVESKHSLRTRVDVGVSADYLHYTSLGKAMLAFLPKDKAHAIINKTGLIKKTENTITDPALFELELENIRKHGYAVDNMEHSEWVRCIGSAIFNHKGEVCAGLSVSGPATRLSENKVDFIGQKVREAAQEISRGLGYVI